ncbi:MAG: protein translocase SEC61 complex subunit gamma [archaeon]
MPLKEYLDYKEYKRVLQITRKPDMNESKIIIKATSVGMMVIGAIGFVIAIIATVL